MKEAYWRWCFLLPQYWPGWLAILLFVVLSRFPRWLWPWWGRYLGGLYRFIFPMRRRIARDNVRRCFPQGLPPAFFQYSGSMNDHCPIARFPFNRRSMCSSVLPPTDRWLTAHFASLGMGFIELLHCWFAPIASLKRIDVEIIGFHHLQRALAKGRGVILMGGHFSHLEIGITLLRQQTRLPIVALYRPHRHPFWHWLMARCRRRHSYRRQLISTRQPRQLYRALQANHIVWIAPDQCYRGANPIFSRLFAADVALQPNIPPLIRWSGAVALTFTQMRTPEGGYCLLIEDHLATLNYANTEVQIESAMAIISRALEQMIERQPLDYLWVHRLFKVQPKDKDT